MRKLSANFIDVSIQLINDLAFSLYTYIIIYVDIHAKRKIFIICNYYFFNTAGALGSACSCRKVGVCCIN